MTRTVFTVLDWTVGTLVLACSTTSRNSVDTVEVSGGAAGEGSGPTSTGAAGPSNGNSSGDNSSGDNSSGDNSSGDNSSGGNSSGDNSSGGEGGSSHGGSGASGALGGAAGDGGDDSGTLTNGGLGGSAGTTSTGGASATGTGGTAGTTSTGGASATTSTGGTAGVGGVGGAGGSGTLTCSPACGGETPVCLDGTCVPCAPNPTASSCADQAPQYCDDTGHWQPSSAGPCQGGKTCSAGRCECALTECGSLCTSTSDDPKHCGRCDHSCQTGDCVDGKCQPVILTSNRDEPWGIAVTDEYLYWVDRGPRTIYRMTLADGSAKPLAIVDSLCSRAVGAVVADASYVYWTGDYACRKPHDGGDDENLGYPIWTGDTEALQALAVNSTTLYALNRGDNQLTTLDQGYYSYPDATVLGIAADDNGLYWLERSLTDVGSIMCTDKLSIDSGERSLESFVDLSEGIAVYDERVYWTASTSSTEATGAVFSVGIAGGSVLTIATDQTNPSAVAVDASGVYWTNRSTTAGRVMRASSLGGDAVAIATNQNGPHGITLDSQTVYWTNSDGGEVMKLAK